MGVVMWCDYDFEEGFATHGKMGLEDRREGVSSVHCELSVSRTVLNAYIGDIPRICSRKSTMHLMPLTLPYAMFVMSIVHVEFVMSGGMS